MRNCSDNDIDPSLNMKRWGGGGGVGEHEKERVLSHTGYRL